MPMQPSPICETESPCVPRFLRSIALLTRSVCGCRLWREGGLDGGPQRCGRTPDQPAEITAVILELPSLHTLIGVRENFRVRSRQPCADESGDMLLGRQVSIDDLP